MCKSIIYSVKVLKEYKIISYSPNMVAVHEGGHIETKRRRRRRSDTAEWTGETEANSSGHPWPGHTFVKDSMVHYSANSITRTNGNTNTASLQSSCSMSRKHLEARLLRFCFFVFPPPPNPLIG